MRRPILGAFLGTVLAAAAAAAEPSADLVAPIQKFVDSFNKGDMKAAAATHAKGDVSIVDEVPPYVWRGSQAFETWSADLANDAKKRGLTDQKVEIGGATREEMVGEHAYVVVPAVYTFKDEATAMREEGQFVFALQKDGPHWLIHSWAWTGPKPSTAGALQER
jgi:hypothetical protein